MTALPSQLRCVIALSTMSRYRFKQTYLSGVAGAVADSVEETSGGPCAAEGGTEDRVLQRRDQRASTCSIRVHKYGGCGNT